MRTKRFLLLWVLALLFLPLSVFCHPVEKEDNLFYYSFNKKIPIDIIPGKFMIMKKTEVSKDESEKIICSILLQKANFDWFNSDVCIVSIDNTDNTEDTIIDDTLLKLLGEESIISTSYLYSLTKDKEYFKTHKCNGEPLVLGMINQISLKYKDGVNEDIKDRTKQAFNLTEHSKNEVFELYTIPKDANVLEISNKLFETGLFEFACPELICKVTLWDELAIYPNDPYFQYQVTLHNTGQYFNGHSGTADADIDAPEAWALTMGSDDIVIAVIDQGVTSDHPDLPNTRQIRLNGSNIGSGNPNDPSPIGNNNHGNACSGIIAATANNEEGIAGVAPLCKIMPIRFDELSTTSQIASAIRFAALNGANIISNSWGFNTPSDSIIPSIVAAITYAISNNTLVLFSAGNTASHANNNNGYVGFPANQSINGLLTIGASDRYDYQADYSPTDTCIDLVAPSHRAYPYNLQYYSGIVGENLDMWSLDIPGNSGYNPWPTDQGQDITPGTILPNAGTNYLSYTGLFGGTSHSCPVVAGVAALVWSMNPNLTVYNVCQILKNTADKIGSYTYDNNGRSNQTGYGRVNAKNAVWMACDTTFFVNETVYHDLKIVTGCDIYMEDDFIYESTLKVRPRNSVIIEKDFEVINSVLDIRRY